MPSIASKTSVSSETTREDSYKPSIFQSRGRIGRARFLLYMITLLLTGIALMVPIFTLSFSLQKANIPHFDEFIPIALGLPFIVMGIILCIRRLNDFNASGWWVIVYLLPWVIYLLAFALLLVPGTPGVNRYGAPPAQDSRIVKILFSLIFIISAVSIIAVAVILNGISNGYYW